MGDVVDPSRASIDGLIDWMRERRVRDPAARLTDLLAGHTIPPDRLIDLACIDLMQRRRMGHSVTVETYLQEFPVLSSDQVKLDLIDAELCVDGELGGKVDVKQYAQRFPDLADAIVELIQLDGATPAMMTSALIDVGDSHSFGDHSINQSADFSLAPIVQSPSGVIDGVIDVVHPVDVPEWFVGEKCIASSPGRWLIQGRDAKRGIALALKVIELPTQVTAAQYDEILDACERAARVRNRAWIMPSIAAIQNRRLAVIRPWIFAHPWRQSPVARQREAELRSLASVAFAIQAAHEVQATHGGIHPENLLVDHLGNVQIIDAVCSRDGLPRWLRRREGEFPTAHHHRADLDVQDLIKLIIASSVEWRNDSTSTWASELPAIAEAHPGEAPGRIGDLLIRSLDNDHAPSLEKSLNAVSPVGRPWRQRLRRWWSLD